MASPPTAQNGPTTTSTNGTGGLLLYAQSSTSPSTARLGLNHSSSGGSGTSPNILKMATQGSTLALLSPSSSVSSLLRSADSMSNIGPSSSGSGAAVQQGYQPLYFTKELFQPPDSALLLASTDPSLDEEQRNNNRSLYKERKAAWDSFSIDSFLVEVRKRIPLESLLGDVKAYNTYVETELVELINKDYTDFVTLSSNLIGIDKVINELRTPLLSVRKDVVIVEGAVDNMIGNIEIKLGEKRELAKTKAILLLFINLNKSLGKIEKLLQLDEESKSVRKSIFDKIDHDTANLIERVASDFNQLKYYVSRGKDFPLIERSEIRITKIEKVLEEGLSKLMNEGIRGKNYEIISSVLRTYHAIERSQSAESLFRSIVVHPNLATIITEERLDAGNKGSSDGLPVIYTLILDFIQNHASYIMELTSKQLRAFNFLTNSIWVEIVDLIIQRIPRIFATGIPELFHRNYNLTLKFIDNIEKNYCKTKSEIIALRNHKSFELFMSKWKLQVYDSLRFQEIASKLEKLLSTPSPHLHFIQQQPNKAGSFRVEEFSEMWESVVKSWSESIYIWTLSSSFFNLTLSILFRLLSWLQKGLSHALTLQHNQQHQLQQQQTSSFGVSSTTLPSFAHGTAGAAATPSVTTDATPNSNEASSTWGQSPPEEWIYLYHDNIIFMKLLTEVLPGIVKTASANHLPSSFLDLVNQGIAGSTSELDKCGEEIGRVILDHLLIKKSKETLTNVKILPKIFRRTGKPPPSLPSHYVPTILAGVFAFFNNPNYQQLFPLIIAERPLTIQKWKYEISEKVTMTFSEYADQAMTMFAKQNQALMNMREHSATAPNLSTLNSGVDGGSGASTSSLTDEEKMKVQLWFDINEFGRELEKLNTNNASFDLNSFQPFLQLKLLVSDGEKLFEHHPYYVQQREQK